MHSFTILIFERKILLLRRNICMHNEFTHCCCIAFSDGHLNTSDLAKQEGHPSESGS